MSVGTDTDMPYVLGTAIVVASLAGWWAARRFGARIDAIAREVGALATAGVVRDAAAIPHRLGDFVARSGARADRVPRRWRIEQRGTMRLRPDGPWMTFRARQVFATAAPEFAWSARFRAFRVVDALVHGDGRLEARLFGVVPVARARDAATTRAQLARYLAELPWVPWAILANPAIAWREAADGVIATVRAGAGEVTIALRFDADGDIVEARGRRDRAVPGGSVPTDWVGTFADYRALGGIRIPTRAEVAWDIDGARFTYFRCDIVAAGEA